MVGTMLFVSGDGLNDCDQNDQNQIDDLLSLCFVMYYLCGLDLPWSDVPGEDIEKHSKLKNDQVLYHVNMKVL